MPNSQEVSTCPYPEPDQCSPHHPIPPLQDKSLHPPTYVLVFLVASSLWLSHETIRVPLLSHSCYMPHPSHPPRLHYSNYTWRRVQIRKLFVMQFSPFGKTVGKANQVKRWEVHFVMCRGKYLTNEFAGIHLYFQTYNWLLTFEYTNANAGPCLHCCCVLKTFRASFERRTVLSHKLSGSVQCIDEHLRLGAIFKSSVRVVAGSVQRTTLCHPPHHSFRAPFHPSRSGCT
jgi:hypothetical protein